MKIRWKVIEFNIKVARINILSLEFIAKCKMKVFGAELLQRFRRNLVAVQLYTTPLP